MWMCCGVFLTGFYIYSWSLLFCLLFFFLLLHKFYGELQLHSFFELLLTESGNELSLLPFLLLFPYYGDCMNEGARTFLVYT